MWDMPVNAPQTIQGSNCSIVIETPICSLTPCENNGTCIETTDSVGYACECTADYTGSNCSIVIETPICSLTPCENNGTCIETKNVLGYICECTPGLYWA